MNEKRSTLADARDPRSRMDPAMSLVGKLEDLSLGEILQIVSLSKRSGLLNLEGPRGEANIYIKDGVIIYAGRLGEKEGILSLLVHHGVVEVSDIEKIKGRLELCDRPKDLKNLVSELLGVSRESFQKVLKKRVEEIVFSLFDWEEGTFSFQLIDTEKDHPLLEPAVPLFLDKGINAQFMVMEGARRRDEAARAGSLEEDPSFDAGGSFEAGNPPEVSEEDHPLSEVAEFIVPATPPTVPSRISKVVLVISDNRKPADVLEKHLKEHEVTILCIEDAATGLTKIQELRSHDIHPCLVLGLRTAGITDGIVLGGLDIITTLWDLGLNLPTIITFEGDPPPGLLEKTAGIRDLSLLPLDTAGLEQAVEFLASAMGITEDAGRDEGMFYDIQGELSDELAGWDLPFDDLAEKSEARAQVPQDPSMERLRSYVSKLNRGDVHGEITLLTLRFATEIFSRAVLFLVRKIDMKGLGQFGVDLGPGGKADSVVRALVLPVFENSLFSKVIQTQQSYRGAPREGDMEALFQALGGIRPSEVYIGPVVSMGKVAVVLYADDCLDKGGIGPTNSLDIFLSHAGLALDRSFLEMKLKANKGR